MAKARGSHLSSSHSLTDWQQHGHYLTLTGLNRGKTSQYQIFVVDSLDNERPVVDDSVIDNSVVDSSVTNTATSPASTPENSDNSSADDRPVLLLIHGYPTASYDWQPLWQPLSQHFRLITADLLGLGFSDKPYPHRYSIMEQADLLEDLLEHKGIERCHVLAHDYGDTVAQELLYRDNQRQQGDSGPTTPHLLSLCCLNGGLFPETHHARLIQQLLASPIGPLLGKLSSQRQFNRSFSQVFGPNTQPDQSTLNDCWQMISYNRGKRTLPPLLGYMRERRQYRQRWLDALVHSTVPLALINGSADPVSGAHMVARFRQLVGDHHTIHALDGIGHYPQLEAPGAVLQAYLDFFKQQPAG